MTLQILGLMVILLPGVFLASMYATESIGRHRK